MRPATEASKITRKPFIAPLLDDFVLEGSNPTMPDTHEDHSILGKAVLSPHLAHKRSPGGGQLTDHLQVINCNTCDKLGSGRQGTVYKTGDGCAVKLIQIPHDSDYFPAIEKNQGAIDRIPKVRSAHVVRVMHMAFVTNSDKEFSEVAAKMELCDTSLDRVIDQYKGNEDAVHAIGGHLLQGMRALHAVHLMHNDLKPDNVFIKDDLCKVGDFDNMIILNPDDPSSVEAMKMDVTRIGLILLASVTGEPFRGQMLSNEIDTSLAKHNVGGRIAFLIKELTSSEFSSQDMLRRYY
ncbi:MAG: serine/threonine protein kinase [Candidatus Marinamargulisbacteria bacterium]|jgi:serine/threonine protein kinase